MKKAEKLQVAQDYIEEIIFNSWTWRKLTKSEQLSFMENVKLEIVKFGRTRNDVQKIVMDIYSTFLYGCGYSGGLWRF